MKKALILCLAAFVMAGCSSVRMKGTPFYTGEYTVRAGQDADRVNLWPALYYRDPALSVLWPFLEKTDDHLAMRPFMSIYGLDKDKREYNVLWPIASFDQATGDSRIAPVFWGKDYASVFPLYWHWGDPFGEKGGTDALVPFWWYTGYADGYSANVLWPMFHVLNRGEKKGWRAWPLLGSYSDHGRRYRFAAWPLAHQWKRSETAGGSAILPLYAHAEYSGKPLFASLPYSRYRTGTGDGWTLVPPLFYSSKFKGKSKFLSLIYSKGADKARESEWSTLIPLYHRDRSRTSHSFGTLLGGWSRDGARTRWGIMPLLADGSFDERASRGNALLGLASWSVSANESESCIVPFYYRHKSQHSSTFVSLPWSRGENNRSESTWKLAPPFYFSSRNPGSETMITPLFARGSADRNNSRWHAVVPLYFKSDSDKAKIRATLLGGWWTGPAQKRWLVYPLLTWGHKSEQGSDLWLAAPFFHASWNKDSSSHHLMPIYYWDGAGETFVSLAAARWQTDAGKRVVAVPPALSWYTEKNDTRNLWLAAGAAHFSWGEDAGASHILPLYYHDKSSETFLSLPYSRWHSNNKTVQAYPPLLSVYLKDGNDREVYALGGLYRDKWRSDDDSFREGHLIPLYYREKGKCLFTPIFGWDRTVGDSYWYPLTPIAGVYSGTRSGSWLHPIYRHTRDRKTGFVSGDLLWGSYRSHAGGALFDLWPLVSYRHYDSSDIAITQGRNTSRWAAGPGKELKYLLLGSYEDRVVWRRRAIAEKGGDGVTYVREKTRRKSNKFAPLYSYRRVTSQDGQDVKTDGSFLLFLYDYTRAVRPEDEAPGGISDYRRSRILWRLWHYEKLNGDVSVDVFPGITYDKREDGFKKISFLWRLFRWEKGPDGRKLDLLFLPLVRDQAE